MKNMVGPELRSAWLVEGESQAWLMGGMGPLSAPSVASLILRLGFRLTGDQVAIEHNYAFSLTDLDGVHQIPSVKECMTQRGKVINIPIRTRMKLFARCGDGQLFPMALTALGCVSVMRGALRPSNQASFGGNPE